MQRYTEQELLTMKQEYEHKLAKQQGEYNKPIPQDGSYHSSMQTQKYHLKRDIETTESSLFSINKILDSISGSTPAERQITLTAYYDEQESSHKQYMDKLRSEMEARTAEEIRISKERRVQDEQDKINNYNKKYRSTPSGGKFKYNPQLYPKFVTKKLYTTKHMPQKIVEEIRKFNSKFQKMLWDPYVKRWYVQYSTNEGDKPSFAGYNKYQEYFCNIQQNLIAQEWSSLIKDEQLKPLTASDRPLTLKVHGKLSI